MRESGKDEIISGESPGLVGRSSHRRRCLQDVEIVNLVLSTKLSISDAGFVELFEFMLRGYSAFWPKTETSQKPLTS